MFDGEARGEARGLGEGWGGEEWTRRGAASQPAVPGWLEIGRQLRRVARDRARVDADELRWLAAAALRERPLRLELTPAVIGLFRMASRRLEDEAGHPLADSEVIEAMCLTVLGGAPADAAGDETHVGPGGERGGAVDGAADGDDSDRGSGDDGRAAFQIALTVCDDCGRGWLDAGGRSFDASPALIDAAACVDRAEAGRRDAVAGSGRREAGGGRREAGGGRREAGDGRRETGDGKRETGDRKPSRKPSRSTRGSRATGLHSRPRRHSSCSPHSTHAPSSSPPVEPQAGQGGSSLSVAGGVAPTGARPSRASVSCHSLRITAATSGMSASSTRRCVLVPQPLPAPGGQPITTGMPAARQRARTLLM